MNAKSPPRGDPAIDKLNSWEHYRLALLVAPHGAGKTTLLRNWTQRLNGPGRGGSKATESTRVAWIDLGPEHNDPEIFLATLVTALGSVGLITAGLDRRKWPEKRLEEGAGGLVDFSPPEDAIPWLEFEMTALANELTRLQGELILVLDHYDHILEPVIHAAISQLLDYIPPKVHLVIACREEPPLPLPRLRARRQMVDILPSDIERL